MSGMGGWWKSGEERIKYVENEHRSTLDFIAYSPRMWPATYTLTVCRIDLFYGATDRKKEADVRSVYEIRPCYRKFRASSSNTILRIRDGDIAGLAGRLSSYRLTGRWKLREMNIHAEHFC